MYFGVLLPVRLLTAARRCKIRWLTLDLNVVLADYELPPAKKSKRSAAGLRRATKRQKRNHLNEAQSLEEA